jgi:hypothetical protein
LVHHAYTSLLGFLRVSEKHVVLPKVNLSRIRNMNAGKDFQDCTFPCPVLANQNVHLALLNRNANIPQRSNSTETF